MNNVPRNEKIIFLVEILFNSKIATVQTKKRVKPPFLKLLIKEKEDNISK
jgi:hypothetical protein